jgi:hypothetical protein
MTICTRRGVLVQRPFHQASHRIPEQQERAIGIITQQSCIEHVKSMLIVHVKILVSLKPPISQRSNEAIHSMG